MKDNIGELFLSFMDEVIQRVRPEELDLNAARDKVAKTTAMSRMFINSDRHISPSQFHNNLCLRRLWLAWYVPKKDLLLPTYATSSTEVDIYKIGQVFHSYQSDYYATYLHCGDLKPWGRWKCDNCFSYVTDAFRPPSPCQNEILIKSKDSSVVRKCAEKGHWVYDECPVPENEYNIVGTADLVLKSPSRKVIIDYKYLNDALFKHLRNSKRLFEKWIKQMQLYMLGLNAGEGYVEIHHRDPNNKKENKPILFPIPRPGQDLIDQVMEVSNYINTIKEHRDPPSRICPTKTCKKAKSCIYRYICFNLEKIL